MRVLVVTNDLPPRVGGIQHYVDQLCRGLAAAGDDVTVYGSTSDGWEDFDASSPYRIVREPTSTLLPTPRVRRNTEALVRRYRPDVVVFGAAFPLGLLAPGLRRRSGVRSVCFTHGLEVSAVRTAPGRAMLGRIAQGADAVTYVSRWCRDELAPAFAGAPRHVLLPPAVDPAEFHRGVDGTHVRRRHGLGDDPVVVCVSRMVARKGQDQLLSALGELRRRVPGTRLLLVGDGPHRAALESRAAELGVAEHVVFTGQVPDDELAAHYAAGDLFAMPCRERRGGLEVEAFGIVFIQAQGVGRPVVAGDIGGVPDSLEPGRTGTLVDGTSVPAVTRAIADILGDPGRATRMGEAGAALVARRFRWEGRSAELRELLRDVALAAPT